MKKSISILYALLLLMAGLTISSCGGGGGDDPTPTTPTPSATETNTQFLSSGNWKVSSVKVDGVDQSSLFTGFTLQFTSSSYTTTNGDPVWPASGSWSFTDATATTVKRSDGVVITISSISTTNFVFTLTWDKTTLGAGRASSVKGTHTFAMTK